MQVQDIFFAAIEIADLQKRADYIVKACSGNETLHREVKALLAAHERSGGFLDVPALKQMAGTQAEARRALQDEEMDEDIDLAFLEPSTSPGSLGRLLHYEVQEVIGRGGCGIVLRAFDAKLHRVVAVKIMTPQLAATSPARKRFLREARATAAIRHENVVSIYAVEEKPLPFLVMEYIDGRTLHDKITQTGPLELSEVLSIGQQIARGLEVAHEKGLVHRDIKPANILLERGCDRVKITDFGLARTTDDASLTQSGAISGTPLYMSPEQAQGLKIDHRSDLFSLGSVLYVMCTGRPPFRAATIVAVLKRVVEEQPRAIREIISEVPDWLITVIDQLHAKKPDDRLSTAKEVAELLHQGESVSQTNKTVAVATTRGPSHFRKTRWLWSIAASFFVIIALVLWQGRSVRLSFKETPRKASPPDAASATILSETLSASQSRLPKNPPSSTAHSWPAIASVPFNATEARRHQQTWAEFLKIPVELTNSIGMKFTLIPPGNFLMGSPLSEPGREGRYVGSEIPHWVGLSRPYYLGIYEVTQEEYRVVCGTSPSAHSSGGEKADTVASLDTSRFPVEMVTWNDAQKFCKLVSGLSDEQERLYRLPTEAEWEFACRAGTVEATYVGNELTSESGNFAGTVPYQSTRVGPFLKRPTTVGSYSPNAFGLYDMIGNVAEWCEDTYDYGVNFYAESPRQDPLNTVGVKRVRRGGAYDAAGQYQRSATRYNDAPIFRDYRLGFRVVLEISNEDLEGDTQRDVPVNVKYAPAS